MLIVKSLLLFLSLLMVTVNVSAQETNYSRFDLTLSDTDDLFLAQQKGRDVIVSVWLEDRWQERMRVDTGNAIEDLAIQAVDKRLVIVWLDASGSHVSIFENNSGIYERIAHSKIAVEANSVELSRINQDEVGVLLLTSDSVRWYEVILKSGEYAPGRIYSARGIPSMSSILMKDGLWICWQEKARGSISVAATNLKNHEMDAPLRFTAKGFGGSASPVLVDSGGPAIVWQSTEDRRAVLSARSLSRRGLGDSVKMPVPEGFSGVLDPIKAVGSQSTFVVHGWNRERWSAVKFDLSGGFTNTNTEVRGSDADNIFNPHLVSRAGTADLLIWSDPEDFGKLITRSADALTTEVVPRAEAAAVQDGTPRFLAFGDSITAGKMNGKDGTEDGLEKKDYPGYTKFLQKLHKNKLAPALVVQRGISGENSRDGLSRLDGELEDRGYDFVLIMEGTNDRYQKAGEDEISLEESLENLREMTIKSRDSGAIPILGTILPRKNPRDRESDFRSEELSKLIVPMAQLEGVTLAYFQEQYPKVFEEFHGPYYSDDDRWVHPDEMGYELMATIWFEALLTLQGDYNRDGVVDSADISLLTTTMNRKKGSFLFNPDCDYNKDGFININDLIFVFKQRGNDFRD